jgi:Fe2+ or Zn2+ uptake regulation protein
VATDQRQPAAALLREHGLRVTPRRRVIWSALEDGENHRHFHCRSCGRLYDVHPDGLDTLRLRENDYVVEELQVTFEGVCPGCRG